MEDITDLILGRTKSAAPVAPSAKPSAATKGDVYRQENLRPEQIEMAIKKFEGEMGLDPRMLRGFLTTPEEFNSYPLEKRKSFFDLTGGQSVAAESQPAAQEAPLDPVSELILGRVPSQQFTPASGGQPARLDVVVEPTIQEPRKVGKVKDGAPKADAATQLGRTAASFIDTTLGAVAPGIIEPVTYAGARVIGKTPEQAKEISTSAAAPFESPIGRAFGVTETPEYQGEATRELFNFVGENFQKGASWIAEKTGLPVQDVENMMGTVAAGAGVKAAPAINRATLGAADAIESKLGTAKPPVAPAPRVEPTMGKPRVSYAEFQAQLEATRTGGPMLPPAPKVASPTMPAPTLTEPFPVVSFARDKGGVSLNERAVREDVLSRVGFGGQKVRDSAVSGDGYEAANYYQTSKMDNEVGRLVKSVLENERATLEKFGQKIVERTGGTLGMDEATLYNRGTAITKPFDDFKAVLQTQMKQAYDQAKQVAGGQPAVNPSSIQKFLDTDSNFTVNDNFMSLRRGIQSHLKENGLVDAEGRISPMTVEQAENLRKYVNSAWSNERSGIIGRIKDNIDNDVTLVAGKDVYKNARDIRTKIARLLEDPQGVAKIMDYDPQSPMNRAVPFEKIATTVERMDVDQQRHLIKLLKEMPPELRPQADAAIAEIRAQFANRILEEASKNQGKWNEVGVTKYLNKNNRKLGLLMEDKELAQMIKDLHDAGHILKYDPSYPGAAIQASNLIKMGAIPLMSSLGGTAGGALAMSFGSPLAATITAPAGAAYGAKKGAAMAEKSAIKRVQQKMVPIKDIGKGK